MPIAKKKNEDFFKVWSSSMAYVLGFIVADGTLIRPKGGGYFVEITSTDRDILCRTRDVLESDLRIGEYQAKNARCKVRYRLQIGSKEIFYVSGLIRRSLSPAQKSSFRAVFQR